MELKWLEDVIALYEEGSFSKAAERRNVTQPAFSRRIKSLENWLGCDIVDRSTQPITILKSALELESEIRALSKRTHELRGRFRAASQHQICLDVACPHTLAVSVFPDVMRQLSDQSPEYSYRLRTGNLDDCLTMCLRGDVDFILNYETDTQKIDLPDAFFYRIVWGYDRLIPVVGGGLRYKLDAHGKLSEKIPLLSFPDSSFLGGVFTDQVLPKLLNHYEIDWLCEAAFTPSLREQCLLGMGLAWLPFSLVWRDIESGALVSLSHQFDSCRLDVILRARKRASHSEKIIQSMRSLRSQSDKVPIRSS